MRDSNQCDKCHAREMLFLPRVCDYQNSALAAYVKDDGGGIGTLVIHGRLQAYVCRACGYTELWTESPQDIPVDEIEGARLLREAESPYR